MTSQAELDQLLQRSLDDERLAPAFFRVLLEATVYAHVPVSDDTGRIRMIQFQRPDGLTVLPFFSDEHQAQVCTGNGVRVVALSGRDLLEATRGATLMLNPNTMSCTLYPEEVAALLDEGTLAHVDKTESLQTQMLVGPPDASPRWLIDGAAAALRSIASVESAHLVQISSPEAPERTRLLIAIGVPPIDSERAARAVLTAIQARCVSERLEVDLTVFDPAEGPPAWLAHPFLEPFYRRAGA
jgi:hypothetical protein